MKIRHLILPLPLALVLSLNIGPRVEAQLKPDVQQDLETPVATDGSPGPGKRVRQFNPGYQDSKVYHLLYLPTDWREGQKFPVIVEYAGNQYQTCTGTVEGSNLGYGISGGKGVIWICMPFVNKRERRNQEQWWGDIDATVDYCKQTVKRICTEYGGDPKQVFIAGFSRGAIACNYIGLHDDDIALLWRGFICHSHYDGVKKWPYPNSDREAAAKRLKRLGQRPQFISHEGSTQAVEDYLSNTSANGRFTFQPLHGWPHTDSWVLYDVPERKVLRDWFRQIVAEQAIPLPNH